MLNASMSLNKRVVAERNINIMNNGANLSSLFSMLRELMTPNLFKIKMRPKGKTKVLKKTIARHKVALI